MCLWCWTGCKVTVCSGEQAETPLSSLFMLLSLFSDFFFLPWSWLLFLFHTDVNCLICGNKQWLQPGLVFHSHTFHLLCLHIIFLQVCWIRSQFPGTVPLVVSWSSEVSHLQLSCLTHFRASITQNLKAREKFRQKGNIWMYFSVVANTEGLKTNTEVWNTLMAMRSAGAPRDQLIYYGVT